MPGAGPGEQVARTYAYHRLFKVAKPRGYRVVGLVKDGTASVWELPGWNYDDAQLFAVNFEDGYL